MTIISNKSLESFVLRNAADTFSRESNKQVGTVKVRFREMEIIETISQSQIELYSPSRF